MKTKRFFIVFSLFLCLYTCVVLPTCVFGAQLQDTVDAPDIGGILASYGVTGPQTFLDGYIADGAGESTDFLAIALCSRYSGLDCTRYLASLDRYLAQNAESLVNPVVKERIALAYIACGRTEDPFVTETADTCIGALGIMSEVFGLHLLHNGISSTAHTTESVVDALLTRQHTDGSFSVTGDTGDVDVTAMAVTALAPNRDTDTVAAAVDAAIDWLAGKMTDDGQFASYGTVNAESGAQVLIALAACGIDPTTDARFSAVLPGLEAFGTADGGYSHTLAGGKNSMATVQAFCAMTALWRVQNGYGPLYVFGDATLPPYTPESAEGEAETETDAIAETETTVESVTTAVSDTEAIMDVSGAEKQNRVPARPLLCAGILVGCAVVLVIQKSRGKKRIENYLFPLGCAAVLVILVWCVRITPAAQYYSGSYDVESPVGTVTISIRCDLVAGQADYIPADGVLLAPETVPIAADESVYDVLLRAAQVHRIVIDARGNDSYTYVAGIGYLYELAYGDLSGWMYRVNGMSPDVGCGAYPLSDGDNIEWLYTCDLGRDLAVYDGGAQ